MPAASRRAPSPKSSLEEEGELPVVVLLPEIAMEALHPIELLVQRVVVGSEVPNTVRILLHREPDLIDRELGGLVELLEPLGGFLVLADFLEELVEEAGQVILDYLGVTETDRIKPKILGSDIIERSDPYMTVIVNRFRDGRGSLGHERPGDRLPGPEG